MTEGPLRLRDIPFRFVVDEEYRDFVDHIVAKARRCVLASLFIIDTDSSKRHLPSVVMLAEALSDAVTRGVFVRVIVGGTRDASVLTDNAFSALGLLRLLGVPCLISSVAGRPSHKKVIVADDYVLMGSHNWSEEAWHGSRQDSVLVRDAGLAALIADSLRRDWNSIETASNVGDV